MIVSSDFGISLLKLARGMLMIFYMYTKFGMMDWVSVMFKSRKEIHEIKFLWC